MSESLKILPDYLGCHIKSLSIIVYMIDGKVDDWNEANLEIEMWEEIVLRSDSEAGGELVAIRGNRWQGLHKDFGNEERPNDFEANLIYVKKSGLGVKFDVTEDTYSKFYLNRKLTDYSFIIRNGFPSELSEDVCGIELNVEENYITFYNSGDEGRIVWGRLGDRMRKKGLKRVNYKDI